MRPRLLLAPMGFALVATTALAGPPAQIDQLAWMTGTWTAPAGPNTLEENWIAPANGSIAAMVRMSGTNGVSMWEVITIEEKDGSLVMNVEQWNAGFEPRTPVQTLELAEIGEQSVKFTAITEGSMKSLGYSLGADGAFTIELGTPDGRAMKLPLKAK